MRNLDYILKYIKLFKFRTVLFNRGQVTSLGRNCKLKGRKSASGRNWGEKIKKWKFCAK